MYSSCSRVESCFKREERNVFMHSLFIQENVLGLYYTPHTVACISNAMHCTGDTATKIPSKNLPSWNSYASNYFHVLCGRRAGKGKSNI